MASEKTDPYIGQTLVNRYRLTQLIGQGAMGRVYSAEDQLLGGVIVAVKFLAQTLLNAKMKERFASEAQTGAQLGQRSIHIVRVLDYGVHSNSVPFYVMEYMEGQNLSDIIQPVPLTIDRFLVLMRHICEGLKCAHAGIVRNGQRASIVHRDIKPSNVFVIQDPSLGELGKVLDFGIAKFLTDQVESSQSRSFMGTLAYCSPEQIEGKDLDGRSDIYSLGVTMFEVLTNQMPIEPETHSIGSWYQAHRRLPPKRLAAANPHVEIPRALEDLVMSCLEKSRDNRPQSMQVIIDRLEEIRQAERPSPLPSADPASAAPKAPPSSEADEVAQASHETLQESEESLSPIREDSKASTPPDQFKLNLSTSGDKKNTRPRLPDVQRRFLAIEDAGWTVSWPADKPQAQIVFPGVITTEHQQAAALWVMLESEEIERRLLSARYNHFLFMPEPHPMVLWITTIYDSTLGARWLPCYLNLKTTQGQRTAMLLAKTGYYPLIYFALEHPEEPANVRTNAISPEQCQNFPRWVRHAQQIPDRGAAQLSKDYLKRAYEQEKPKILMKLNAATPLKFFD
ncbi:serine/threonine protein kinase [Lyngbya confervoides]|uniref:Serine/threonine protein kinase n=1 Tax=Lyngbya confervoides BDU141951 TaxID=1574623 RepID=A0ABD4T2E7_9CYAN|nr:serine/threonine-protein kinase [Lyngbya confervoides]MCM1982673.1 serine/threonine protein kinase [Lyngbya confervoides BDU141951]